jgi:hypothetical protein
MSHQWIKCLINIASYDIMWVDRSHISEITKNSQTSQNRIAFLVRFTHYVCETWLVLFYLELYSGYIDRQCFWTYLCIYLTTFLLLSIYMYINCFFRDDPSTTFTKQPSYDVSNCCRFILQSNFPKSHCISCSFHSLRLWNLTGFILLRTIFRIYW